jgi:hypothetical protein
MSDKETEFGQYTAQGDQDPSDHAKNVEEEAKAHGDGQALVWDQAPGANQGGN